MSACVFSRLECGAITPGCSWFEGGDETMSPSLWKYTRLEGLPSSPEMRRLRSQKVVVVKSHFLRKDFKKCELGVTFETFNCGLVFMQYVFVLESGNV